MSKYDHQEVGESNANYGPIDIFSDFLSRCLRVRALDACNLSERCCVWCASIAKTNRKHYTIGWRKPFCKEHSYAYFAAVGRWGLASRPTAWFAMGVSRRVSHLNTWWRDSKTVISWYKYANSVAFVPQTNLLMYSYLPAYINLPHNVHFLAVRLIYDSSFGIC